MSYIQLIKLFLILNLINYSYQYNRQNNHIQRRIRDTDFRDSAQRIINAAVSDEDRLATAVQSESQAQQTAVRGVTQTIMQIANQMATAGVTNVTSTAQWTQIQNQLRTGLNTIINAYKTFITLHRRTCDDIERHAQDMITRYETEISTLNQLSVPTITNGMPDADWLLRFSQFMGYADLHRNTLDTALDCPHDLIRNVIQQRQIMMYPPTTGTVTYRITNAVIPGTTSQDYSIPCNQPQEVNLCQICAKTLADLSRSYATNACSACQPSMVYQ